jgi:hypothetical protein
MRATVLLVLAASAALWTAGAASSHEVGCTPGQFSSGSTSGVAFCGPAKATVKVAGKTYAVSGGACTKTSKYVNVNIGMLVLSGPKKKFSYFGLLAGRYPGAPAGAKATPKDGAYAGGLVSLVWKGKSYSADTNVKITLKKGRSAGSFSGVGHFTPNLKVSGTFTC